MASTARRRRLDLRAAVLTAASAVGLVLAAVAAWAIQVDRNRPELLAMAGRFARGSPPRLDLAARYLDAYLKARPDDVRALDLKVEILAETASGPDDLRRAIEAGDRARRLDPSRRDDRRRLLDCYLRLHRLGASLPHQDRTAWQLVEGLDFSGPDGGRVPSTGGPGPRRAGPDRRRRGPGLGDRPRSEGADRRAGRRRVGEGAGRPAPGSQGGRRGGIGRARRPAPGQSLGGGQDRPVPALAQGRSRGQIGPGRRRAGRGAGIEAEGPGNPPGRRRGGDPKGPDRGGPAPPRRHRARRPGRPAGLAGPGPDRPDGRARRRGGRRLEARAGRPWRRRRTSPGGSPSSS